MTSIDLASGRITSFRREQGFGLITLDDGTPVKFDAGICTMLPEEGAPVRVRTAPAKWGGGLKALHVEPVGAPPAFLVAPRARPLEDLLAIVQGEHLVSGLTESVLDEIVAQRFGGRPEAGTILELLDAYYAGDPARARSDGYLCRGADATDADGVLAELAAILPDAGLPRPARWTRRDPDTRPVIPAPDLETMPYAKVDEQEIEAARVAAAPEVHRPPRVLGTLVVRDPDGSERARDVAALADVIELANAALRRAGDARRIYRLDAGGRRLACLALAADRALRLAAVLPFAPPPDEIV